MESPDGRSRLEGGFIKFMAVSGNRSAFLGEGSNEKQLTNHRDHTNLEVEKPGPRVDALRAAQVDIGH